MVSTLQKVSDVLTKIMRVVMVVLFIWMVFIGATEIIFNDEHIKVTVIEDLVHGLGKKIVLVLQDIVGLIFSVMLAYYSFPQVALASKAVSSNMDINMGIVYGIFPVVTILMVVAYLFRLILVFAKQPEKGGEQA